MEYKEYKRCANCINALRVNFINDVAVDTWCGKHNTNFTPTSKCDYWERNTELGDIPPKNW